MTRTVTIPEESIANKILLVRDQKVMLDRDLAELYEVETKQLKRAVRRNIERFPEDFMFELTLEELENLRCHFGTSSWGGTRYPPMAFTEQGIAMLSSVIKSPQAIQMNIHIMRVYTKMRQLLMTHKDILLKIEHFEQQLSGQDKKIELLFSYLKRFLSEQNQPRKSIGFRENKS